MSVNITDNMQVAVNLSELRYLVFNGMKGDTGEKGDPGADGVDGHSPYINASGYWVFWNDSTGAWVTTNYKAAGTNGTDGHSPYIGENGNWFAWSEYLAMYDDTGVKAQGPAGADGVSPTVTVTTIAGGHRVTITDEDGAHTFDVMDGEDGEGGGSGGNGVIVDMDDDNSLTLDGTTITAGEVASLIDSGVHVRVRWDYQGNESEYVYLYPRETDHLGGLDLLGLVRTPGGGCSLVIAGIRNSDYDVLGVEVYPVGSYSKPSGGIPASDLASAVQTSLGKADTALQSVPFVLLWMDESTQKVYRGTDEITGAQINALADATNAVFVWDDDNKQLYPYVEPTSSGGALFAIPQERGRATLVVPSASSLADHDWEIPVISDFYNDAGYQTAAQVQSALTAKLDANQGAANAGKFMVVGNDGNITAVTMTAWQGGSY